MTRLRASAAEETLFEYPPQDGPTKEPDRNRIIYTRHDHKQLHPPKFLNDTNISFFMQYHLDSKVEPELKDRIHIFSSFFFPKIKSMRQNSSNGQASRWLRNVEIFKKDFLILPVCEKDHWLLVIVCYPAMLPKPQSYSVADDELFQPAVIVLNSCTGLAPSIKKALSHFLKCQWLKERGTERIFCIHNSKRTGIRLLFPDLPQQKNNYDCGVYTLGFFYSFLNDPRGSYLRMYRRQNLQFWFKDNNIDISRERRKMLALIRDQIARWASTHETTPITNGRSSRSSANSPVVHMDDSVIVIH